MMPYRFVTERQNYSDYASGRVFYGLPGHPAFPVRLASEIFQRALALREGLGSSGPCVLYDPCCGGAYHLSTLAYLHWESIGQIIASDVDAQALVVAERNLGLLTLEGLDQRIAEISEMLAKYKKLSHSAALGSVQKMRRQLLLLQATHPVATRLFVADALAPQVIAEKLAGQKVDVVIADIPYGQNSAWQIADSPPRTDLNPVEHMLTALLPVLSANSVVAIASDKQQAVAHASYRRLERFQIGKRRMFFLQPLALPGA